MHEVQHAIQNEEELATGGSRKLAYAALVSDAYEAVKNTPEFQSLQTKEERCIIWKKRRRNSGRARYRNSGHQRICKLGGEKMARQRQSAGITPKTSVKNMAGRGGNAGQKRWIPAHC
ncbi:MAG: hypothetical protein ACLR7U_10230 [Ruthenibacterium lactatiformans]